MPCGKTGLGQSPLTGLATKSAQKFDAETVPFSIIFQAAIALGRPRRNFLELDHLDLRIDEADALIKKIARENEACQRLVAIPGIGPVTATALIAAIGNGAAFHKGREFAAWMGVVPREHSTGGQQKLLGISKRGNSYLRRLFVQGARAVLQQRTKQSSGLSAWLAQLTSRTHRNVAAVALANRLARIAWAVLAKNEQYRPPVLADVAAA